MSERANDDGREQGVEMGDLDDDLEAESYPIDKEELLSEHGDESITLSGEERTLSEVIGPIGVDEFESADDVRQTIFNMVGDEAVGRKGYTDRGASSEPEEFESDEESF